MATLLVFLWLGCEERAPLNAEEAAAQAARERPSCPDYFPQGPLLRACEAGEGLATTALANHKDDKTALGREALGGCMTQFQGHKPEIGACVYGAERHIQQTLPRN